MNDEQLEQNIAKNLPRKISTRDLVSSLPRHLKEPRNYEKVLKAVYEAGASTCDHSEVIEWYGCVKCQNKQKDRAETMRRLGFQNGQQYLAWRKIHEEIRSMKRVRLEKYNT
mgnify:CR=1 FL=1